MSKEFDRVGIPVAVVSALPPLALHAGANRVVQGVRIEHVFGDPSLAPDAERTLRENLAQAVLNALATQVEGPTLLKGVA